MIQIKGKKRLVVFDVAGTTIQDDDLVLKSFLSAFVNVTRNVPKRDEVDHVMGMSKRAAIRFLLNDPSDDSVVERVYNEFLKEMIKTYRETGANEIPGASETFSILKEAGFFVALNTGFPRVVLDVVLKSVGWNESKLIDATISSDEVSEGRPAPYMIFKLMEKLKIDHVELVTKVGDTLVDVEEGLSAGCGLVIGVTSGTCKREDFEASQLTGYEIVSDLTDVPNLLGISS